MLKNLLTIIPIVVLLGFARADDEVTPPPCTFIDPRTSMSFNLNGLTNAIDDYKV
jgi:hypothetical protein